MAKGKCNYNIACSGEEEVEIIRHEEIPGCPGEYEDSCQLCLDQEKGIDNELVHHVAKEHSKDN